MSAPIAFTGVVLETPMLERTAAFYSAHFGLEARTVGEEAVVFAATSAERAPLELRAGAAPSLVEISFAVADTAALEQMAEQLRLADAALRRDAGDLVTDSPDGWTIRLHVGSDASRTAIAPAGDRPAYMSHAVLNSLDPARLVTFLERGLGLMVSDRYERDLLVFMKCAQPQHHCIGVAPANACGLNHFAVDCGSIDVLMRGVSRMRSSGYEPIWGPGRHGPGGNVFCYFEDPTGFVPEYTCEVLQIEDGQSWSPAVWERSPSNGNVWLSGGPTPRAIELMSGEGLPGTRSATAAETTE